MAKRIVAQCPICDKEYFKPASRNKPYCSMACYRVWQRGPDFVPGRKPKLSGKCAHCHADVYRRNHSTCRDGRKSEKVFCNRDCYDNFRTAERADYIAKTRTNCKNCGKALEVSHRGQRAKTYCGDACRIEARKPKPQKCINCGCIFSAIKWFKGRKKATRVTHAATCGSDCHNAWIRNNPERKKKISLAFTGDKHPNWQGGPTRGTDRGYRGAGWKQIAEKARKRDGHCCQHCGMTQEEHGRALEVHHIIPFNQFQGDNAKANRMSNLITLCKSCHMLEEWKWREDNQIQMVISF